VPIEIGNNYLADDWSQKFVTLNEFVDKFIVADTPTPGYLAQTQLFEQIPELRKDIITPVYCNLSTQGEEEMLIVNAWYGPKATVSPLHHDPYHNLFAQVVGQKYWRIYSPRETPKLYPHDKRMLNNTSQVDVENPDLHEFPEFSKAQYVECILQAGELLYVPPKVSK
jgi:lysine-specific demethylase 8